MAATIAHRGRISTGDSCLEFRRNPGAQNFQFSELRKSKREGLLELFWGEQPPFALLRSVEGGTFFPGAAKAAATRSESRSCRAAGNRARLAERCCRLKPETLRQIRR